MGQAVKVLVIQTQKVQFLGRKLSGTFLANRGVTIVGMYLLGADPMERPWRTKLRRWLHSCQRCDLEPLWMCRMDRVGFADESLTAPVTVRSNSSLAMRIDSK